jgi:hypothetical protein
MNNTLNISYMAGFVLLCVLVINSHHQSLSPGIWAPDQKCYNFWFCYLEAMWQAKSLKFFCLSFFICANRENSTFLMAVFIIELIYIS